MSGLSLPNGNSTSSALSASLGGSTSSSRAGGDSTTGTRGGTGGQEDCSNSTRGGQNGSTSAGAGGAPAAMNSTQQNGATSSSSSSSTGNTSSAADQPLLAPRERRNNTENLMKSFYGKKDQVLKKRNFYAFQRSLLEEQACGAEEDFSMPMTARGGRTGGPLASDLLQTGGPGSRCPTPRQHSIHRKENRYDTPSKQRIDSESFLNTPMMSARGGRRNSLTTRNPR
ncbi:unnamed protein product [Amoebophrya sp. A120]|nr:unnamed protein product [Amoebophrya sp. A120]|eukprot:GSA120T00025998001.1